VEGLRGGKHTRQRKPAGGIETEKERGAEKRRFKVMTVWRNENSRLVALSQIEFQIQARDGISNSRGWNRHC